MAPRAGAPKPLDEDSVSFADFVKAVDAGGVRSQIVFFSLSPPFSQLLCKAMKQFVMRGTSPPPPVMPTHHCCGGVTARRDASPADRPPFSLMHMKRCCVCVGVKSLTCAFLCRSRGSTSTARVGPRRMRRARSEPAATSPPAPGTNRTRISSPQYRSDADVSPCRTNAGDSLSLPTLTPRVRLECDLCVLAMTYVC